MATLSSLRNAVRSIIIRDDVTDATIDQRINWTLQNVASMEELPDLETSDSTIVLGDTRTYSLPSDVDRVLAVRIVGEPSALAPVSHTTIVGLDQTSDGIPYLWARYDNNILIYPTPDSTYQGKNLEVFYQKRPTALSANDDPSPLPDYYDEVLVVGAAYRVMRDLLEFEKAEKLFRHWRGLLNSIRDRRALEAQYQDRGAIYSGLGRRFVQ